MMQLPEQVRDFLAPTDMVDRLIHPATGGAAIVAVVLGCSASFIHSAVG